MAYRSRRSQTRKARGRPLRRVYPAKNRRIRRGVYNPSPTFVETFALPRDNMFVPAATGLGKYFAVRIQDVPQVTQYANLYTQYRINWVKVMLIPQFNTSGADINAAEYNQSVAVTSVGLARMVYSIQDSPGQVAPTSENEVLEDNGCKIKPMGTKWSCSFKPVPDITQNLASGAVIPVKAARKQWFNFDTANPTNNPLHGGVKAFITLPGTSPSGAGVTWFTYYKVSFSLRDPQ